MTKDTNDVSIHVCLLEFRTIENGHYQSLKGQFRSICLSFGSINSNFDHSVYGIFHYILFDTCYV